MKRLLLFASILVLVSCTGVIPAQKLEQTLSSAQPGDTIILKTGVYEGLSLHLVGRGTETSHIVVMPEAPGSVVITGRTSINITGEGLELQGLLFKDGYTDKQTVIELQDGDKYASHCRITECVFDNFNPASRENGFSMIHIYGRHNRVDHCSFLRRLNTGMTIVVRLTAEGCDENYHSIDHNYFGPRPVYGSNGSETMQVGMAGQCMQSSRTTICDNFFDRVNGEVEIVSIKSCDNIVERNFFYECQGVLALRHGDRNIARDNVFIGNGVVNTGGIRIVGEDQKLLGNRFYGLKGRRFFAPLALMCGVPNSLPNRYIQVRRAHIEGNLWSDCAPLEFDTGYDLERTLKPADTEFIDNTITTGEVPPSAEEAKAGKGASWYTCEVKAGQPEIIEIKDSTFVLEKSIEVKRPTIIRAAAGLRPVVTFRGKKQVPMIKICDGASLTVQGLVFDNWPSPGRRPASHAICTATKMITPYVLKVEDCEFRNFENMSQFAICGLKGTFADSLIVRDCFFHDMAGQAINFSGEYEDKGRYNADDIIIEDCRFFKLGETAVNIYRGGSDESTAGPRMKIRGCTFDNTSNKVRGQVLRLIGVQELEISGCTFKDSGKAGYSMRLDDAPWDIITFKDNRFTGSGPIQANRTF